jgi:hypothetical protein
MGFETEGVQVRLAWAGWEQKAQIPEMAQPPHCPLASAEKNLGGRWMMMTTRLSAQIRRKRAE